VTDRGFTGDLEFLEADNRRREKFNRCWKEHVKEFPEGSLNLPPLLEKRRHECQLAKGFFDWQSIGDYVMVCQIEYEEDKLFAGSPLERPQAWAEADKARSFVGVLTSAGCTALDVLESEGVGLGHIVRFMRYTPFKCKVDELISAERETCDVYGIELVASDIRASMDLAHLLREGKVRREVRKLESGAREHVFVDESGEVWDPQRATVEENFL